MPNAREIETRAPARVFCAYSHKDEELRTELESHLAVLRRAGLIETWHDGRILPGAKWEEEILRRLLESELILLLISADFLASRYCWEIEMKEALERHAAGRAIVIPIILRPVAWGSTELSSLQALPRDGRPIFSPHADRASRDQAFVETCEGVVAVLMSRQQARPGVSPAPVSWPHPRFRKRVLDAAITSRVPVEKATMVVVMVRMLDSPGLGRVVELEAAYAMDVEDVVSKPIRLQFPRDERGMARALELLVTIQAPDFEPARQSKGLAVPSLGDSEPRVFLLTAKRSGSLVAHVEVSRGNTH